MPDIARFVRVFFPDADGAASHLVAEHKGADKACQNQGIDAGRIPAFAEQGFRADQNLHCALGKNGSNSCGEGVRVPRGGHF